MPGFRPQEMKVETVLKFVPLILGVIACVCVALALAPGARAQIPMSLIVDPVPLQVGEGQVERIELRLQDAHEIYVVDIRARFDPDVIEVIDADPSTDGVQLQPGDFVKPDFIVRNEVDNKAGTIQYVASQVNPTPPVSGNGVLLSFEVRGKARGKTSHLEFFKSEAANTSGTLLPIRPEEGEIQVVAPKPETPTPTLIVTATISPTRTATRQPTRPRATAVPAATASNGTGDLISNLMLGAVAFGGCLGSFVILGFAVFLLRRQPHVRVPTAPPPPSRGIRR